MAPVANSQWRVVDHVLDQRKVGSEPRHPRAPLPTSSSIWNFAIPNGEQRRLSARRYEVQISTTAPGPNREACSGRLLRVSVAEPECGQAARRVANVRHYVGRPVGDGGVERQTVIGNQEIPEVTGGALDSDEGAPGPLMLQGDHGPIEYRNIILTPAK